MIKCEYDIVLAECSRMCVCVCNVCVTIYFHFIHSSLFSAYFFLQSSRFCAPFSSLIRETGVSFDGFFHIDNCNVDF